MNGWTRLSTVLASAAALCLPQIAQAALVVDPGQPVAGMSQLELSERWWQWALGAPAASNPLLDTSGDFAGVDNDGPVFFVAGNTGGTSIRSFSVPVGRPIFFPLVNAIDVEIPAGGCDVSCALGFLPDVGGATGLHATLDGQNLLVFPSFRQTSTSFFAINVPVDNAFGFPPPYVGILDGVTDGYWVALEGLRPGLHVLEFGGSIPGTTPVEVNAFITVVPEPATLILFLAGTLAACASSRNPRSDGSRVA